MQAPFEPVVGGRPVAVTAILLALVFAFLFAGQEIGRIRYRGKRLEGLTHGLPRPCPRFAAWTARGEHVLSGCRSCGLTKHQCDVRLPGKAAVLVFMDLSDSHLRTFSAVMQNVKEIHRSRATVLAVVVQRSLPARALAKIGAADHIKVILDPDYRVAKRFDAWEFPAVAVVNSRGRLVDLLTRPDSGDLVLIGLRLDDPYEPLARLPRPSPEFQTRTTARRLVSSESLAGKPFVAVFVGRDDVNIQEQVVRRVGELVPDTANVVLFLSPEGPSLEKIRSAARSASFHVVRDPKGKRADQWGVKRFPAVAITDPSGTLAEVLVGLEPDSLDEYWTQRVLRAGKLRKPVEAHTEKDAETALKLSVGRFVGAGGVRKLFRDGERVCAVTFAGDILVSNGSSGFRVGKASGTSGEKGPPGVVLPDLGEELRGVHCVCVQGPDGDDFTVVAGAKPMGRGRILIFSERGKCVWRASTAPGIPLIAALKSKRADRIAVATPSGYLGWLHFTKKINRRSR